MKTVVDFKTAWIELDGHGHGHGRTGNGSWAYQPLQPVPVVASSTAISAIRPTFRRTRREFRFDDKSRATIDSSCMVIVVITR